MLELVHDEAPEQVDVAVVAWTWPMFSALQQQRRSLRFAQAELALGADLAPLVDHARRGSLVVFLGAGVSAGAGLPTWSGLLNELGKDCDFTDAERQRLGKLSPLDQARLIAGRLRLDRSKLGARIGELTTASRHSLAHALLAALPVDEYVTTNYDELFEIASDAADRPLRVLPYSAASDAQRWLLKLHGSVGHPDDIVLTREDYLRYSDQRQALVGVVQALLMTRHMLFVGFSLDDDNFHRIVDDVRKVVRPAAASDAGAFGTALLPGSDALLQELWLNDLNCIGVGTQPNAAAFRELEIILDRLSASAVSSAGHLLDEDFVELLAPEDRRLRDALVAFEAAVDAETRCSPAWEGVARLLEQLGRRSF
jgi:hypothetical protein